MLQVDSTLFKSAAKKLAEKLNQNNSENKVGHSNSLHELAKLFGYDNYNTIKPLLEKVGTNSKMSINEFIDNSPESKGIDISSVKLLIPNSSEAQKDLINSLFLSVAYMYKASPVDGFSKVGENKYYFYEHKIRSIEDIKIAHALETWSNKEIRFRSISETNTIRFEWHYLTTPDADYPRKEILANDPVIYYDSKENQFNQYKVLSVAGDKVTLNQFNNATGELNTDEIFTTDKNSPHLVSLISFSEMRKVIRLINDKTNRELNYAIFPKQHLRQSLYRAVEIVRYYSYVSDEILKAYGHNIESEDF